MYHSESQYIRLLLDSAQKFAVLNNIFRVYVDQEDLKLHPGEGRCYTGPSITRWLRARQQIANIK